MPCRVQSKSQVIAFRSGVTVVIAPSRFEQVEKNFGMLLFSRPTTRIGYSDQYLPVVHGRFNDQFLLRRFLHGHNGVLEKVEDGWNHVPSEDSYVGEVFCQAQLGFDVVFEEEIRPE